MWLSFLLLVVVHSTNGSWNYDLNKEYCGTFYSEPDYGGYNYTIASGKQYLDMRTVNMKPKDDPYVVMGENMNWDNQIASVSLQSQCRLRACANTSLQGVCQTFSRATLSVPQELGGKISSIECSCPAPRCTEKKCEDIQLRERECARAFFEPNCNTCEGYFLAIPQHEKPDPGNYIDDIKSVIVKEECTLTTYSRRNFQRESDILGSGHVNNWSENIGSYKCECDNTTTSKSPVPRGQLPGSPRLIDIPLVPGVNQDDHPALAAAMTSMRNNRSPRNAYILVIGLSGSGKSSAINLLFDKRIANVGSEVSTTKEIHEYQIPVQVDELGCKNCELRVIDTPGFGDTEGLDSDAAFLAGLEAFLETHDELNTRIPNVVLVFSSMGDNRFGGRASPFVKTLRGIDIFRERLFDPKYSNVVTVLTHFMKAERSVRSNPADRLQKYRDLIELHTVFTKPIRITVAENRPDESGTDIPLINGYYKLPNNEFFPLNLFEAIQDATGSRDPIGEAIIRNAFKRPEDFVITERTFELRDKAFHREPYFLSLLTSHNFNTSTTEIANITQQVFFNEISPTRQKEHPGSLEIVNNERIFTKAEIPKTTLGIVSLFKKMRLNPVIEELLEKAFDLKAPEFPASTVVGNSFDILQGEVLPRSPFLISMTKSSNIGYKIPTLLTCEVMNKPHNEFNLYDTRAEYLEKRLAKLKFSGSVTANLSGYLIPGSNTVQDYQHTHLISALRELRLFQLTLNQKPKLSQEFIDSIKLLSDFNRKNQTVVDEWQTFFGKYGTHVVSSAYGGGAIGAKFKIRNSTLYNSTTAELSEFPKSILEFTQFLESVMTGKSNLKSQDIDTTRVDYNLEFFGGDFQFRVPKFSQLSIEQTSKSLDGFVDSLYYIPTILSSDMEIKPISAFLSELPRSDTDKLITAAMALYHANLTYVPPQIKFIPPLERPEVISYIKQTRTAFIASIERLKNEIIITKDNYTKIMQETIAATNRSNILFEEKLTVLRANTMKNYANTCFHDEADLKGIQFCTADMSSCVNVMMTTKIYSVNTHNACVRFYQARDCAGTYVQGSTSETTNTAFPLNINANHSFSVLRCDSAITD